MSVLLLAGAAWVLGTWVLRALRIPSTPETWIIRMWTGLSLCALAALTLGMGSLQAVRFVLYVVSVFGLGYEVIVRPHPDRFPHEGQPRLRFLEWICITVVALALTAAFVRALVPVTDWEAKATHLAVASEFARQGRLMPMSSDPFTAYLTPLHALYAYAYFDGEELGASLLSWSFGALACGSLLGLGWRTGGRAAGLIAAAILASAPALYEEAGTVSVDLACAGLLIAGLWQWMAWEREGESRYLVLAGLLLGTASATRPIVLVAVALTALGTLITPRVGRARSVATLFALAFAVMAPWWLYTVASLGRLAMPGFPYVSSPADFIPALDTAPAWRGWKAFLMFPWDIVMRPMRFDGWPHSPGGLILFLGLPGLLVGGPWARRLGFLAVAGGIILFFVRQGAQAYLPLFLPMMIVAALAAVHIPTGRRLVAVLLVVHFAYGLGVDGLRLRGDVHGVFGKESRAEYLARRLPNSREYEVLTEKVENGDGVLALDGLVYAYRLPAYRNYRAVEALSGAAPEVVLEWFKNNRIRYVVYPRRALNELPGFRGSALWSVIEEWRNNPRVLIPFRALRTKTPGPAPDLEVYEVAVP